MPVRPTPSVLVKPRSRPKPWETRTSQAEDVGSQTPQAPWVHGTHYQPKPQASVYAGYPGQARCSFQRGEKGEGPLGERKQGGL